MARVDEFVEARIPVGLHPFVSSMAGYRVEGAGPGTHIGMPSGSITLIISLDQPLDLLGADGRQDSFDTAVAGLHARPAHIHHDGRQHGIELGLTPSGAAQLVGGPAGELAGTSVDLDAFLGPRARHLHEQVSETSGWAQRFALVTSALFADAEPRWQPRAEVAHAWRMIEGSRGRLPIGEVAREVGWSPRHLAQQFRREYGHTPKTTARVLRFEEGRSLIAAGRSLVDAATAAGYADQSHLNRDWLDLAGTSPTRWLREDEIAFVQDASPGSSTP